MGHDSASLARYQELVKIKHTKGLTSAEAAEMETLGQQLDDDDEPFYRSVIERLKNIKQ